MNAPTLVPAVRELFSQHPRASRLAPEQVAGLLWILCYVGDDEPLEAFEVAAALEVLDIETGRAAPMSATAKRTKCSGCGKRIPTCEPVLVLRKDGSEKKRYFHERCMGATQRIILSDPDLWLLSHRHVNAGAN